MQGDSVVIPGEDGLNSCRRWSHSTSTARSSSARCWKYLIETPERAALGQAQDRGVETCRKVEAVPFRLAEDLQPGEVLRIKSVTRATRLDFRVHAAPACVTPNAISTDPSRRPSSRFPHTSTMPGAKPRRRRPRGLEVLRLVNEPMPRHSPTVSTKRRTASAVTTWAAHLRHFDSQAHDGIFSHLDQRRHASGRRRH